MGKIKRFRVFNADEQLMVVKCDTTEKIYQALKRLDLTLAHYFVDCVVDDIEVTADEFIEAWESGEHFEDLQFF